MKQLLLFLTILTTTTLVAQHKYIPFPDSNAIWVIQQLNDFGHEVSGFQEFIQKDTTINGISYHKVVGSGDSTLYTPGGKKEVWYGLRNDTALLQVFIYDRFAKKEYLLYDFSLQVGDTFPKLSYGGRYGNSVILDIDTITIDSKEHLIYFPYSVSKGNLLPYIEGIGSLAGALFPPYFFEGGFELVCLMLGKDRLPYYTLPGKICKLYHSTGIGEKERASLEIKVYPQPLTHRSVIELQSENELIDKITVFSMDGKVILEQENLQTRSFAIGSVVTQRGMYFFRIQTTKGKVGVGKFNC